MAQQTGEPAKRREVQADAERFLRASGTARASNLSSADGLHRVGLNVRKASAVQHIQAIALAYATSIQIAASPHRATVMAELETISGRKRSRATTDLHLIVERFVAYGGAGPAEQLAARKLISRDVRAIQHLETRKVLPSRVAQLATCRGEGLHAWARQSAVVKKARTDPAEAEKQGQKAKAEARERALTHEVKITTRRPDGTRVRRQRLLITGKSRSEMSALVKRLKQVSSLGPSRVQAS